jgi:hypothetical protein
MSDPIVRTCGGCGAKNRVPARHLADHGRCGGCQAAMPPIDQPLDVDAQAFREILAGARGRLLGAVVPALPNGSTRREEGRG